MAKLPAGATYLDQLVGPPHVQTSTATDATIYEPRALWTLLGFTVQDDPDNNNLIVIGGSTGVEFVWQPGGTAGGNVFTDFAAACAACKAANLATGARVTLWVDDSYAEPIFGFGAWDFGPNCVIRGVPHNFDTDTPGTLLTNSAAPGASWVNWPVEMRDISLDYESSTQLCLIDPPPTFPQGYAIDCHFYNCDLQGVTSGSLLQAQPGATLRLHFHESTRIEAGGFTQAFVAGSGGTIEAHVYDDCVFANNVFDAATLEVYVHSSDCNPGIQTGASYIQATLAPRGVASSGTTGNRPTGVLVRGAQWFDTTLGKPIWWNGSGWVDATGASV